MSRITRRQIAALKYLIFRSKNATGLAKRILVLLINRSDRLSKEVYFTLWQDRQGYSREEVQEATESLMAMQSMNCTTHLNELLPITGTKLQFNLHYGHFENGKTNFKGQFAGDPNYPDHSKDDPLRYTFYLQKEGSDWSKMIEVKSTRKRLEKLEIRQSGLYMSN